MTEKGPVNSYQLEGIFNYLDQKFERKYIRNYLKNIIDGFSAFRKPKLVSTKEEGIQILIYIEKVQNEVMERGRIWEIQVLGKISLPGMVNFANDMYVQNIKEAKKQQAIKVSQSYRKEAGKWMRIKETVQEANKIDNERIEASRNNL